MIQYLNKAILFSLLLFSLLLLSAMNSHASPSPTNPSLDITLESIDDSRQALYEFIGKGQWVILNIWGTRCPPCREEMPELVMFHDEHKDTDAIVLGIAIDFPSYGYAKKDEVAQFVDDYLIDFPVLLSDANITKKIGLGHLEGLPTTYIFNPSGSVSGMQVGGITKKIIENFIEKNKAAPLGSANK
ncbi:hypothetical protein MNBD_GAMMA06-1587 [hydrothermal vent metagenome]|uniref:Thioredoxin domain-containing protein n=1 Tax=hydrothermal vent metagenome TaxID=652676 RepID=A0A3B0X3G9_9ZZZZ